MNTVIICVYNIPDGRGLSPFFKSCIGFHKWRMRFGKRYYEAVSRMEEFCRA